MKRGRASGKKGTRGKPAGRVHRRTDRSTRTGQSVGPRARDDRGHRPRVGQELLLDLSDLTLQGECIAYTNDYVLFVPGAIPGEQVIAQVVSAGPRYGRARVVEFKHRSPFRVEPRCRHFGECGGCSWQHIDYSEQLRWKERLLRSTLQHHLPGVHLPIRPILGMPDPWGTRTKAQFLVCSSDTGRPALGYYRAHSRDPVAVVECPVHHPTGNRVARTALRLLDEHRVAPYSDNGRDGVARHVMVRVSGAGDKSQAVLVASRAQFSGVKDFGTKLMSAEPSVTGVHLNLNSQVGTVILGPETRRLSGDDRLSEEIGGVQFLVSPNTFFQTSSAGATELVRLILNYVPATTAGTILDLYAGVGLFSLPLARRGHRVVAVEENPNAVRDGIASAKHNRISGCRFLSGKVETNVKRLARDESFEVVLLDPPREGCPEWVLRMVARGLRPRRVVDVSCDPTALARDIQVLVRSGYRVLEVQPVDMFPHTAHIESVAVLCSQ